ncbi:hypothetical protein WOLCODRAFT_143949 [Wolfiporia cocos MD-104 SS10]|uniref:XLF-like N-terminal domain-containing protein n=1 Tax=Wolfiporia cocos (strain MD-104) TaxID=742152 RepID=A0A2H3JTP4_WOLCO|nr:hypothetical protein WOLCODRAFT_143949 [Wolfiporia cocos MD-104 SS10]
MEYFSEEHAKLLIPREWLVKIDSDKSTPYLMKFYGSIEKQLCCAFATDTKNVWGEVLTMEQFVRRWQKSNPQQRTSFSNLKTSQEEEEWRAAILEFISSAHSLGGLPEVSFEIVESHNADLHYELSGENFKWKWEMYHLGPKFSAEILSQHLIVPLISMSHLAFSSTDPVGRMRDEDLERAADRIGRTARRTLDTHLRHAMSKPQVTTTLQRLTALFNFVPRIPPITSEVEVPNFVVPHVPPTSQALSESPEQSSPKRSRPMSLLAEQRTESQSPNVSKLPPSSPCASQQPMTQATDDGSDTEPEEGRTHDKQKRDEKEGGVQQSMTNRTSPPNAGTAAHASQGHSSQPPENDICNAPSEEEAQTQQFAAI